MTGRMSVAPERGTGVSRISCLKVAGVGPRMEDGHLEAVWVHEKRLSVPNRRSTTIWDCERENPLLIHASEKTIAIPTCLQARGFGVSLLFQAQLMTQPAKLFQYDSGQFVLKSPTYTQTHVQEARKLQLVLGAELLGLYASARRKGILVATCSCLLLCM